MPGCVVVGCTNSSAKGFKMKTFPRDSERRKIWETNVKRENWKPTNASVLCEKHFSREMWEKDRVDGKRKLKHDAIPTLFSYIEPKRKSQVRFLRPHNKLRISDISELIIAPSENEGTEKNAILSRNVHDHSIANRKLISEENLENETSCEINHTFLPEYTGCYNTIEIQCTRNSAKQTCGSPNTQLYTNTKENRMTLQKNVKNFEEIDIKQEPLEENTNDYKYMWDDLLSCIVKEENDGEEYDKDNKNEINTKEESATLTINEYNVQNISDKEECIEKKKCTFNKNSSNDKQSCINNDILDTKHTNTNNLISECLKKHRKNDSELKKFTCSLCNRKFTLNFSLKRHMEDTHLNMMPEMNFPVEEIYIKEEVVEDPLIHGDSFHDLAVKSEEKEESNS